MSKVDSVKISKEGSATRPAGVTPAWIPPVFKKFYEFTHNMASAFASELNDEKKEKRTEEFTKSVIKHFERNV